MNYRYIPWDMIESPTAGRRLSLCPVHWIIPNSCVWAIINKNIPNYNCESFTARRDLYVHAFSTSKFAHFSTSISRAWKIVPWMSRWLPITSFAIREHSMCHPGLPSLQGEGHLGSPAYKTRAPLTFLYKRNLPAKKDLGIIWNR